MISDGLAFQYKGTDGRFVFVVGLAGNTLSYLILEKYQPLKSVIYPNSLTDFGIEHRYVNDGPEVYREVNAVAVSLANSNGTPQDALANWLSQAKADSVIESYQINRPDYVATGFEFAVRLLPIVNTAIELADAIENPNDPKRWAAFTLSFANDVGTVATLGAWQAGRLGIAATSAIKLRQIAIGSKIAGGIGLMGVGAIDAAQGNKLEASIHISLSLLSLWGVKTNVKEYQKLAREMQAVRALQKAGLTDKLSGLFHDVSDDVLKYWESYYKAAGVNGDDLTVAIARLRQLGFKVQPGEAAALVKGSNVIKFGPNTKTWELYEEAIHHSVQNGLGKDEIAALAKELRKSFWQRGIRRGSPADAAEEIFVKTRLLRRLDLDEATRTLLEQQIKKLRSRGMPGGY
jgi:hypothetical protein